MVLVISNKGDIHCNSVINHFINNGTLYFRLNTETLGIDYRITFLKNNSSRPYLEIYNKLNQKLFDSREVTAIWDRRPLSQSSSDQHDNELNQIILSEINELNLWIRYYFHGSRMIGSSVYDRPNESKIRQMYLADKILTKNHPIKFPETIITNDYDKVIDFIKNHEYVAIKPIGSDAYQVDEEHEIPFVSMKTNTAELQKNLTQNDLDLAPIFLQEYVEKKHELRVTSVGDQHFCCLIDSQKLQSGKGKEDWREGYDHGLDENQKSITTPEEIEKFCNAYLDAIQANFGCFDFILGEDDKYYFLECNPNGQWLWLEEDIGLPISKAIADYLINK